MRRYRPWLAAVMAVLLVAGCTDNSTHVEIPENPRGLHEEPPQALGAGAPSLPPDLDKPSDEDQ